MPLNSKVALDIARKNSQLASTGIIGGANTSARTIEREASQNLSNLLSNNKQAYMDTLYASAPFNNSTSTTNNSNVTVNTPDYTQAIMGLTNGLNDLFNNYLQAQSSGAAYANAQSQLAQQRQFEMNKELMNMSAQYQTESAKTANNFTQALMNQAMQYNSLEARKNRDYQTQMSNTAYQRAVEDMRKAGLNPILAYQNGGASVGSGATASIGSGSGQSAGSISGSVGNYSGQGYNVSDKFAALSALIGGVGTLASAFKTSKYAETFNTGVSKIISGVAETVENSKNWLIEHNWGYKLGKWIYDKKSGSGGGGHGF